MDRIKEKIVKEKRLQFNTTLKAVFKELRKKHKWGKWPINPDAYTFFSYYDEGENCLYKIFCVD